MVEEGFGDVRNSPLKILTTKIQRHRFTFVILCCVSFLNVDFVGI